MSRTKTQKLDDQRRLIAIQRERLRQDITELEPLRAQVKTLQVLAIAQQESIEDLTRTVEALTEIVQRNEHKGA